MNKKAKVLVAGYLVGAFLVAMLVVHLDAQMRRACSDCLQAYDGPYQTMRVLLQTSMGGLVICAWQAIVNAWWNRTGRGQREG